MLTLQRFRKKYGPMLVLDVGDLEIPSGIFWVKGTNGSGKSTFLKALAGILSFEGDVLLGGKVSVKKNPVSYRKVVNFAAAEPLFPEFLTAEEMIRLFTEVKGVPFERADWYAESIGMAPYLHQPIGSFSSGMVKKLSLILAFTGKPRLILLDEPLITLDADSLDVLYSWMVKAHRDHKVSFMVSSHQSPGTSFLRDASEILVENKSLNVKHVSVANG